MLAALKRQNFRRRPLGSNTGRFLTCLLGFLDDGQRVTIEVVAGDPRDMVRGVSTEINVSESKDGVGRLDLKMLYYEPTRHDPIPVPARINYDGPLTLRQTLPLRVPGDE